MHLNIYNQASITTNSDSTSSGKISHMCMRRFQNHLSVLNS